MYDFSVILDICKLCINEDSNFRCSPNAQLLVHCSAHRKEHLTVHYGGNGINIAVLMAYTFSIRKKVSHQNSNVDPEKVEYIRLRWQWPNKSHKRENYAQVTETRAHRPERSIGGARVQFPGLAGRSRVRISGAHTLRLISWAGKEGSTVSSIICDRWLILS